MYRTPVILRIDLSSSTPAVRQIVDGLRLLLVTGELGPGAQLPSVRRLGMDLGVHFNTVAEAYRILAAEGWLEIARRGGTRVVARKTPRAAPEAAADFERRLRELIADGQAQGFPRSRLARELHRLAESLEGVRS